MLGICAVSEFEFGKAIVGVIDSPGAAPDLALNWLFFGVPFENATNRSNRGRDSQRASIDRFRFRRRLMCRILRNLWCKLASKVFRKLLEDLICYLLNHTTAHLRQDADNVQLGYCRDLGTALRQRPHLGRQFHGGAALAPYILTFPDHHDPLSLLVQPLNLPLP